MTKDQELAILARAADDLGPHSYLGPWLNSVLPEIAQAITSDVTPSPELPHVARLRSAAIIEHAEAAVCDLRQRAEKDCADLLDKARRDADQIRAYAVSDLRQAAKKLGADL